MTEATDAGPDAPMLPGLGDPPQTAGEVERAARRTIAALEPVALGEQHAVMCQALLACARQLDRATSSSRSKDYGVAELISQLRETYKVLAPDDTKVGGEDDAWSELVADLRRSAAAVRDTA